MCLRLTVALARDELTRRTTSRPPAPRASPTVGSSAGTPRPRPASIASLVSVTIPAVVTNLVLVEWVFSIPGFFRHTKRALAQAEPPTIDVPTLQALALWASVLIVVISALADIALVRIDPRLRATGKPPG
jgi:hypothetical protein